jgi:hypothetical protein
LLKKHFLVLAEFLDIPDNLSSSIFKLAALPFRNERMSLLGNLSIMIGNCCQEKIILVCLWKSLEINKDKTALNTPIGKEGSGLLQETSTYLLTLPRTNIKGTLMAEPRDFIFTSFLSIGIRHGTNRISRASSMKQMAFCGIYGTQ